MATNLIAGHQAGLLYINHTGVSRAILADNSITGVSCCGRGAAAQRFERFYYYAMISINPRKLPEISKSQVKDENCCYNFATVGSGDCVIEARDAKREWYCSSPMPIVHEYGILIILVIVVHVINPADPIDPPAHCFPPQLQM